MPFIGGWGEKRGFYFLENKYNANERKEIYKHVNRWKHSKFLEKC